MFFSLSKIIWAVLAPSNLFGFLAMVLAMWRSRYTRVPAIVFTVITACLILLPVGNWILAAWERQGAVGDLPATVDGIIILGGAVEPGLSHQTGQVALNSAAERMAALPALMRRYPDARIIFTGGSGDARRQEWKEADYARDLFQAWGLDMTRILFEDKSRNTFENATYSKQLVAPAPDGRWLLVTSASHMPRALRVFAAASWPVIPFRVDFQGEADPAIPCFCLAANLGKLDVVAHEALGIAAYNLSGKTK